MFFKKKQTRGDKILETIEMGEDEVFTSYADHVKSHGVTDDDIKWWWDMPDFQHAEIFNDDQTAVMAAIQTMVESGSSKEDAFASIKKNVPRFEVYPNDKEYGDDDLLPYELKRYVIDAELLEQIIQEFQNGYSSINHCIRVMARAGKLQLN